jgi:hypothetical protein
MAQDERRSSVRQRTVLRGCVYYDKRSHAIDCVVRNMSDGGAKLELSENVVLPELIELYIQKKEITFPACVRWRRVNEVGVAFLDGRNLRVPDHDTGHLEAPAERGHDGVEIEDRLQKLEAEMLSLKVIIRSVVENEKKGSGRLAF